MEQDQDFLLRLEQPMASQFQIPCSLKRDGIGQDYLWKPIRKSLRNFYRPIEKLTQLALAFRLRQGLKSSSLTMSAFLEELFKKEDRNQEILCLLMIGTELIKSFRKLERLSK